MRRSMSLLVALVFLMTACGGTEDVPGGQPEVSPSAPEQELTPVVASSDVGVGKNRFLLGLLDENDAPIRSPETTLRVGFLPPGSDTIESVTEMEFIWSIKDVQGLWVGTATFSEPGEWRAAIAISGEYSGSVGTAFEVKPQTSTPPLGAKAPLSDTPTADDPAEIAEISTDTDPDPRFYEMSIAQAVKAGRPAVIVFSTPKFCESQTCGPTLQIVKKVAKDFPDVTFVHVEPYDLDLVPDKLEPVKSTIEWGLPSEPFVFVTDSEGRVAAKFEGALSSAELEAALQKLG